MKNIKFPRAFFAKAFAFVSVLAIASVLSGCGSDPPAQSISTATQVNDMVAARKIFDESADKNYDNLPADKKAEYVKLTGGTEAKAKHWWGRMQNPGAGPEMPPAKGS